MQFDQMEAVTISTMNGGQVIPGVSQSSPVPGLQAGLLQQHVMQQTQVRFALSCIGIFHIPCPDGALTNGHFRCRSAMSVVAAIPELPAAVNRTESSDR